jgi:hypothetical protein
VSDLADAVLPLIRTRADVWRWGAANEHGRQIQEAVAMLRAAAETEDPADVFAVTQKAIASALKVIMRADDSSGIIGDTCRALLDLHPKVAARAKLADLETRLGPRPPEQDRSTAPHSGDWFTLDWNAQRLAVLDATSRRSSAPTPATGTSRSGT